MSDKKHIDRLFQEKFKDFEAKPSNTVWNNIQNQLDHLPEEKPKTIPLWIRIAGVAALALLLFTIGNHFYGNNQPEGTTKTIVDNNNNIDDSENTDNASNAANTVSNINETVSESNNISNQNTVYNKNESNSSKILNPVVTNETTLKTKKQTNNYTTTSKKVANTNYSKAFKESIQNNKKEKESYHTSSKSKYVNTVTSSANINKTINEEDISSTKKSTYSQSQYANASNSNSVTGNNKVSQNTSDKNYKNNTQLITKNKMHSNSNGIVNNNNKTVKTEDKTNDNNLNKIIDANTLKKSLAQTNNEEEKTNMNPQDEDAQTPNPLEEAILANTEDSIEKEEEETVMNRWTVNANVAPVYYNTLGKGSHIHDQFIDNPKNGEINTSYGINVGYALNDRIKVRSGISKLNLSYDTANVIIYENVSNTPSSAPLRNINFTPNTQGQGIGVLSANDLSIQQVNGVVNDELDAALSQRLSYIEVPIELEYALVNNRIGLNIIGGVSTFILNDNEVVTEVENRKTKIGEANNINTVSFTTNFGLGLDYKFSDTFKFNLEPTFKYQVNAYNETSGNFNPYIIGVYTGFSYKF